LSLQLRREPSKNPCEGNRIIAIKAGHYEDVDLAGVSFLVTFTMRSWSKIYVSDTVSDRQMRAVEALLPIAFAGFHKGMLSFTKAPITMDFTEKRVRFSGPESSVEMEVLSGFGGKPVTVMNLPSAAFSGLHPVQVGVAQARQRQDDVQLLWHQRLHVDMDVGVQSTQPAFT
jgi:hypothetical protein